jgi:hypothetical protein
MQAIRLNKEDTHTNQEVLKKKSHWPAVVSAAPELFEVKSRRGRCKVGVGCLPFGLHGFGMNILVFLCTPT